MAANQTDRTDNAKLTVTPVQTMPAPTVDNAPPNSNGALKVPADYVRQFDTERHTTENVRGNRTAFTTDTETSDKANGEFDNRVLELFDGAITEREKRENSRANHRNFNRLLTLLGAVLIGLVLIYASQKGIIPKTLAPYTFVITVLLDSTFTAYALYKHY